MSMTKKSDAFLLRCTEFSFGHAKPLMPPLDWMVGKNELWAVIGENGSGKTTLMKSILGLMPKLDGLCELNASTRYISQIDQSERDVPQRVSDYVSRGLYDARSMWIPGYAILHRHRVKSSIEELDLSAVMHRQFEALSEGMKQRAKLAQALVSRPKLLFLDEATSAMDPVQTQKYYISLRSYLERESASCIVVSHHFMDISSYLTHALVFCDGNYVIGEIHDVMQNKSACALLKSGRYGHG